GRLDVGEVDADRLERAIEVLQLGPRPAHRHLDLRHRVRHEHAIVGHRVDDLDVGARGRVLVVAHEHEQRHRQHHRQDLDGQLVGEDAQEQRARHYEASDGLASTAASRLVSSASPASPPPLRSPVPVPLPAPPSTTLATIGAESASSGGCGFSKGSASSAAGTSRSFCFVVCVRRFCFWNRPSSALRSVGESRSRAMLPPKQSEIDPRSSETTTTTASVSSVTPMAARWRVPSALSSRAFADSGKTAPACAMRRFLMITAPSWSLFSLSGKNSETRSSSDTFESISTPGSFR